MAKYRSPFKASSRQTTAYKKKGSWSAGYHTGIDRVCDSNKTLVSPADGTIQKNSYDADGYGYYVVITTSDGKSILMAHLKSKSSLKVGASIKKGATVGTMGNSGNSSGAHLHIEVQKSKTWAYNKNLLDPDDYINWTDYSTSSTSSTSTSYPNGAQKFDSRYKNGKTYTVKANGGLRIRKSAGTGTVIKVLKNGTKVTWYGYYSVVSGVTWKYVKATDGTTGFVSAAYLK